MISTQLAHLLAVLVVVGLSFSIFFELHEYGKDRHYCSKFAKYRLIRAGMLSVALILYALGIHLAPLQATSTLFMVSYLLIVAYSIIRGSYEFFAR